MHTSTLFLIIVVASVTIVWIAYELRNAPDEEELWPDLKQRFEGEVWHRSDYANDQKAI